MRHRPLTLVFSVLILVLTGVLFQFVPKGLFPPDDTGQLMATTEAAQGTSYDEMVRLQTRAAKLLEKDPNVLIIHVRARGQTAPRARPIRAC